MVFVHNWDKDVAAMGFFSYFSFNVTHKREFEQPKKDFEALDHHWFINWIIIRKKEKKFENERNIRKKKSSQ